MEIWAVYSSLLQIGVCGFHGNGTAELAARCCWTVTLLRSLTVPGIFHNSFGAHISVFARVWTDVASFIWSRLAQL